MKKFILIRALYIISIIGIALFGCSKKVVHNTEKQKEVRTEEKLHVNEMSSKNIKEVVTPSVNTRINIPSPCDSNGRLKEVFIEVNSGKQKSTIDTRGGILKADCDCDSTISRLEQEIYKKDSAYHRRDSTMQREAQIIERIKHVIPMWCWITMISLAVLFLFVLYCFIQTLIIKFR